MKKSEEDDVLKQITSVQPRREDKGAFWIGVAFVVFALLFPTYQSVMWLQTGAWEPLPIASGIRLLGWKVPSTDWVGLQKIISWLFDLPLWTIPAFLAFGAFSEWKETT